MPDKENIENVENVEPGKVKRIYRRKATADAANLETEQEIEPEVSTETDEPVEAEDEPETMLDAEQLEREKAEAEAAQFAKAKAAALEGERLKTSLEEQVTKLRAEREALAASIESAKLARSAGEERNNERMTYLDQVDRWMSRNKANFYGQLVGRVDEGIAAARQDVEKYSQKLSLTLPPENQLVTIRKKFHKSLIVRFFWQALIATGLILLPWLLLQPKPEWYKVVTEPDVLKTIAGLFVLLAVLFVIWRRNLRGKRVWPAGRMAKWILIAVLIGAIIWFWNEVESLLRLWVSSGYYPSWQSVVIAFAVTYLTTILFAILTYHVGFRKYETQVTTAWYELSEGNQGAFESRREVARLESLVRQLREWLELIAVSLHNPWKTHPDWSLKSEIQIDESLFPMSIRPSMAVEASGFEGKHDPALQMVLHSLVEKLTQSGWRAEAFKAMIQSVERLKEPGSGLSVEALDRDIPGSPNQTRRMVREHGHTDEVLQSVARKLILENLERIQNIILTEADLKISRIRLEGDEPSKYDELGQQIIEDIEPWVDFLGETVGDPNRGNPALALFAFDPQARNNAENQSVSSIVVAPERVIRHHELHTKLTGAAPIVVVPLDDAKTRVYDLVLRADVAGVPNSVNQESLQVWSQRSEPQRSRTTKSQQVPVCPNCGLSTCPAADPTSNQRCAKAGI